MTFLGRFSTDDAEDDLRACTAASGKALPVYPSPIEARPENSFVDGTYLALVVVVVALLLSSSLWLLLLLEEEEEDKIKSMSCTLSFLTCSMGWCVFMLMGLGERSVGVLGRLGSTRWRYVRLYSSIMSVETLEPPQTTMTWRMISFRVSEGVVVVIVNDVKGVCSTYEAFVGSWRSS